MKVQTPIWVAVQGPDGVGKSIVVGYLQQLMSVYKPTVKLKAVGSGTVGVTLRESLLSNELPLSLNASVSAIAHSSHYTEVVRYLNDNYCVISDRYIGCFYAYNINLLNDDNAKDIFNLILNNPSIMPIRPDIIIHLDSDISNISHRLTNRDCEFNNLDKKAIAGIDTLNKGYRSFYANNDFNVIYITNNSTLNSLKKKLDKVFKDFLNTHK